MMMTSESPSSNSVSARVQSKRSPKLSQELGRLCEHTGEICSTLSTDVPHRWNSTYKMISAALRMRRALDMLTAASDFGSVLKENALTDQDWEDVSNECKDLELFELTTRVLSVRHCTESMR